jgi:hypothetical protein
LQGFYPCRSLEERKKSDNLFVPPEVLLDAKCQSADFDRVFPKTDAQFHYDKFNQLRLSNDLSADRETQAQAIPEHIQHKQVSIVFTHGTIRADHTEIGRTWLCYIFHASQ